MITTQKVGTDWIIVFFSVIADMLTTEFPTQRLFDPDISFCMMMHLFPEEY